VPSQNASKLLPFKDTVIDERHAATITESIATMTEVRQSMNTVTLNLKDFLIATTGSIRGFPSTTTVLLVAAPSSRPLLWLLGLAEVLCIFFDGLRRIHSSKKDWKELSDNSKNDSLKTRSRYWYTAGLAEESGDLKAMAAGSTKDGFLDGGISNHLK
jgi:hypothetical protein